MIRTLLIIYLVVLASCTPEHKTLETIITSPDADVNVDFFLSDKKKPSYVVRFKDEIVIDTSTMGYEF